MSKLTRVSQVKAKESDSTTPGTPNLTNWLAGYSASNLDGAGQYASIG
jgi:hypothetical protein